MLVWSESKRQVPDLLTPPRSLSTGDNGRRVVGTAPCFVSPTCDYDRGNMRCTVRSKWRAVWRTVALAMKLACVSATDAKTAEAPAEKTRAVSSSEKENETLLRETTSPRSVRRADFDRYPAHLGLTIHVFGVDLDLELERDDKLFGVEYLVLSWHPASSAHRVVRQHPDGDHCHYVGRVANTEANTRSSVVLSTCRGLEGHLQVGNTTVRLEPVGVTNRKDGRDVFDASADRVGGETVASHEPGPGGKLDPIPVTNSQSAWFDPTQTRTRLRPTDTTGAHEHFHYTAGPQTVVVRLLLVNDKSRIFHDWRVHELRRRHRDGGAYRALDAHDCVGVSLHLGRSGVLRGARGLGAFLRRRSLHVERRPGLRV